MGVSGVAAGLVSLALAALCPAPAQVSRTHPALVYGDSLTWEAQAGIEAAVQSVMPDTTVDVSAKRGIALCDALPWMERDAGRAPSVVVIAFVGNHFTPCMEGRDTLAAYREDLSAALALWSARGARVVLVGAPLPVGETAPGRLAELFRRTAETSADPQLSYADAGAQFRNPWTGVYRSRLGCLTSDVEQGACDERGTARVRAADGTHFCPIPDSGPCAVYCSGVTRYSTAIGRGVALAVGQDPGRLPPPVRAPGARDVARSIF